MNTSEMIPVDISMLKLPLKPGSRFRVVLPERYWTERTFQVKRIYALDWGTGPVVCYPSYAVFDGKLPRDPDACMHLFDERTLLMHAEKGRLQIAKETVEG